MVNFISEDDIELELLNQLKSDKFWYNVFRCSTEVEKQEDLNDWTWRKSKRDVILPKILKESLKRRNPNVDDKYLDEIFDELSQDFSAKDINQANFELYNKIRWPFKISVNKNLFSVQ